MSDQPTKTESELSDNATAFDNAHDTDTQQTDAIEANATETETVETEANRNGQQRSTGNGGSRDYRDR